jgi:hypothetical protein
MTDFMSTREALRYFGIAYIPEDVTIPDEVRDQLENLLLEHDLDIETDNRGTVMAIDPIGSREALFKEHLKKVGHRPDDPAEMSKEKVKKEKEEKDKQDKINQAKELLKLKKEKGGA